VKKRVLDSDVVEHTIISDDSDVEEIAPLPIMHNPATIAYNPARSTNEAAIAASVSPNSAQETIDLPQPAVPGRNTLSFILNEENVSPAIRPTEVTGLPSHLPPLPSLAVPDLREEEIQVHWDFKKDWSQAAKVAKALHAIVRAQHRKQKMPNLWVQSRINGMLALCYLFSRPGSKHTWTEASELAAEALGHGTMFARKLRQWVIEFEWQNMVYEALPLTRHGRFDTCRLFDEDLSRKIQEYLLQLRKTKRYFKADDIVDFVASPDMQAAMGTRATFISKTMAQCWLKRMDWRYGRTPNGMYVDGHEREDVVEYCAWFLAEYGRLERRMRRYNSDGVVEKEPELREDERVICEVTHDESTFYAND